MAAIPLNVWAKKINIVLEINIDSYSLADRREGTNDFKTFGTLIKVTLHFKISYCNSRSAERKREKSFTWHWRNSKEKERLEVNGEQMKRQMEITRELKTGRQLLLAKFKKLSTYKMLWL